MARITFKKAVTIAAVSHVALFVISVLFGVVSPSAHDEEGQGFEISPTDYIETERIATSMVSEQQITMQMEEFNSLRQANAASELKLSQDLKKLEDKRNQLQSDVAKAGDKLETMTSDVALREKELKRLAEKEAEAKKNAEAALEREAKLAAKKLKAEQDEVKLEQKRLADETARKELESAQLEATRAENAQLLKDVRENNRNLEKRQLAKARGVYEKGIHDALIRNWQLPYMRERVNCKVFLTVTPRGVITKYKIHQPCPVMYANTISDAIDKTAFLPSAADKIFKDVEIVNFVDSVNGVFVK
ncbi:hypothetical protein VCHA53O466_40263 [Vibrio chagasii]|nr:hypothetical protein VCHA53O466_40263 [Vibrio chagasii]